MSQIKNAYLNTVIYKIVCNDLNVKEGYIGQTVNFEHRKQEQKSRRNRITGKKYNLDLYSVTRSNNGWENYSMLIVEMFSCNASNEARTREQQLYEFKFEHVQTIWRKRSRQKKL